MAGDDMMRVSKALNYEETSPLAAYVERLVLAGQSRAELESILASAVAARTAELRSALVKMRQEHGRKIVGNLNCRCAACQAAESLIGKGN